MVFTKTEDECMKYDRRCISMFIYISRRRREDGNEEEQAGGGLTVLSVGVLFDDKKKGRLGSRYVFGGYE